MARFVRFVMMGALVAFAVACGSTETEEVDKPQVQIDGPVAVLVGETITLTATTLFGTDSAYTWASTDETVATVVDGVVTGVAAGTAAFTATGADTMAVGTWGVHVWVEGGETVTEPMIVLGGPVGVKIGETITLVAETIEGEDSGYSWASDDEAVATVVDGVVTGVTEGDAKITATGLDTEKVGSWGVAVLPEVPVVVPPAVVTITGDLSLEIGGTLQLTAETVDGTDASYAWTSGDETVVTVDDAGLVTGIGAGEAIITATGADTGKAAMHGVVVLPAVEEGIEAPYVEYWEESGHADSTAEAFRHWDEDDPAEISTSCAKCHSSQGYVDFLGADGTAAGTVDNAVPAADVMGINCVACHNAATMMLDSVTFPSGETVTGLDASARCMQCHQGRSAGNVLEDAIVATNPADDDDVPMTDDDPPKPALGFKNVHYFAAGATLYGAQAIGAYQYDGMAYDGKFAHIDGGDSCLTCHSPHTLEVKVDVCSACHDVDAAEDLVDIRMAGSLKDYDGDGDMTEGIKGEIDTLVEALYAALQANAVANAATDAIIYDSHSYPYFFKDTNENGTADDGEVNYGNKYATWSPRLLRGAYNYQYALKDPGAYAHNAKYVIQFLIDSIGDLGGDVTGYSRNDAGHFDGTTEAWRHWDEDDFVVSASCARCHSATGLPLYAATGGNTAEPVANGMTCGTCHNDLTDLAQQYAFDEVTFPSGQMADAGNNTGNLCMSCHQGRESATSVDTAILTAADESDMEDVDVDVVPMTDDDPPKPALGFKNIHYFAAGATLFGTQAKGAYEYAGMHYDGRFMHADGFTSCQDCHDVHTQALKVDTCAACHEGAVTMADLHDIRMPGSFTDFDGDAADEGIAGEIDTLTTALYAEIQAYALATAGVDAILYDSHSYPYFFKDTNENGTADDGEVNYGNKYSTFTPRLLRAAFNYQYALKDPGAFAHNAKYLLAVLYDSIEDLGGDVSAYMRNDGGHFDGTAEAWRHWDEDGGISSSCAKCHTPEGFREFLDTGAVTSQPVSYGMTCGACHTDTDFAGDAPLRAVASVTFPGGTEITNDSDDSSFLCMTCHSGRKGKGDLDDATDGVDETTVSAALRFQNVHYLSAGASLYGGDAHVGYEYEGKTYAGKFGHYGGVSAQCISCHDLAGEQHSFHVEFGSSCTGCHSEGTAGDPDTIRKSRTTDYDGDGDNTEPLGDEIHALADALWAQIQAVADDNGFPITNLGHYPYFGNPDGSTYKSFTPAILKAIHNYQITVKEHGAWAHNTDYTAQLVIDAIESLGGDVSTFNRP